MGKVLLVHIDGSNSTPMKPKELRKWKVNDACDVLDIRIYCSSYCA